MRDALLLGGAITLATKDTLATGTNVLDFGAQNSKYRDSNKTTGQQENAPFAYFQTAAALAAGDYFYGVISHCDTEGGTYTPCAQTKNSAAACAAGTILKCPLPVDHLRYIRLDGMPKSSGTFTEKTVNAWIEH